MEKPENFEIGSSQGNRDVPVEELLLRFLQSLVQEEKEAEVRKEHVA